MNYKSQSIVIKNLKGRPARTGILIAICVLLGFFMLGGLLLMSGLSRGIDSLNARLGADIMVVPYEAAMKNSLDDIVLQGATGSFYMSANTAKDIENTEGVGEASEQFYLATLSAGCCSLSVQLIGFDPEGDFVIMPWIKQSNKISELKDDEVLVGNSLNAFAGDTLTFFSDDVKVAGKLDKTGTYYDTAVFANDNTIKTLLASAKAIKAVSQDIDPDNAVSCVMVNVADGYAVDEVLNDINLHVKGVKAVRSEYLVSDVTEKMTDITTIIWVIIVLLWILSMLILTLIFHMIINERKKEFAIMLISGMSRAKLKRSVILEGVYIGLIGCGTGSLIALIAVTLFGRSIERSMAMPFLLNDVLSMVIYFALSVAAGCVICVVASSLAADRVVKSDVSQLLRGNE